MSKRAIAGTAVACSFLLLALMSGATFAILKKRRPEQSSGRANPFGEVPKNVNCNSNYAAVDSAKT